MGTDGAALGSRRRRQLLGLVVVCAVVLAIPVVAGAVGWLGREPSFPAVSASVLSPLPPELDRLGAGGFACPTSSDGEPSVGHTIIRGDDGQVGGRLAEHLQSLGFSVTESDEKWHGFTAQRGDEKVVAGSAADYLEGFPASAERDPLGVAEEVMGTEPHAVVVLMPVGAECRPARGQ
jgi:hypothetical protein